MRREEIVGYCLSKPGAVQTWPFGDGVAVVAVAVKMFALCPVDADPPEISLKCDPTLATALRSTYRAVRPGYHLNKQHTPPAAGQQPCQAGQHGPVSPVNPRTRRRGAATPAARHPWPPELRVDRQAIAAAGRGSDRSVVRPCPDHLARPSQRRTRSSGSTTEFSGTHRFEQGRPWRPSAKSWSIS